MNTEIQPTNESFSIPVDHVSDTAYLVAAYRLAESKRPDRYFNDALAERLLGGKGEQILEKFSQWKLGEWMMTVRTTLIDRTLMQWIENGLDTVVNLAAGLDTRPYRMNLPKSLLWIEADLEGIIQYKAKTLANEVPRCRLNRIQVNLSDVTERSNFFKTFSQLGRTVVLTEGLLLYLNPGDVRALSDDLLSHSNVKGWMMDITTKKSFAAMQDADPSYRMQGTDKQVHFKFLPDEGIHYFEPLGWRIHEYQSYFEFGQKINRNMPENLQTKSKGALSGFGFGVLTPNGSSQN
jgi:methyltransferase (TIGR00027 family)